LTQRLLLALLVFCWTATASATVPITLGEEGHQPLGRQLALLDDPAGTMDIDAVRAADAAGGFRPVSAEVQGLGYRPGATWVRIAMLNPTSARQERWLEFARPMHNSAILHRVASDGTVLRLDNGARVPVAERPLASRNILFPLTLDAGEMQTVYLRLASRTATVIDLQLWRPIAYADRLERFMALKYLGVGSSMVLVVYSLLAWQARGKPAMMAAGVAQILAAIAVLVLDGFAIDWFPANDSYWQLRVLSAALFLSIGCHIVFAREFLRLPRRFPRLSRGMLVLAWGCLVVALFDLAWFQPQASGVGPIVLGVTMIAIALVVARRERGLARTYLTAWGLLWLSLILRNATLMGWLPGLRFVNDLPTMAMAISAMAMSLALHLDIRSVRLAGESARDRLLKLQRTEQGRLVAAVESRTRELRDAKARAEEASQAKSDFLSTISHELRTPLHTILGYAQLLRKVAGAEIDAKLAIIESSGTHLLRLIDQVLDFGRGEARSVVLRLEPTSIESLVAHLADSGRLLAAEGDNRFSIELAGDVPAIVEADDHRLTQVLQNLISNACKYTRNGRVTLRIARQAVVAETPPAAWVAALHRIEFSVADTGIGIAPEDQVRIFEPFSRIFYGSKRQPGVGLGLTIARQLVQAMGGEIGIESTPGRGSRFFFSLVLREVTEEGGERQSVVPAHIVGHKGPARTLLVADDIAENRMFLQDFCRFWGFNVLTAADGAEALNICRRADPPVDAVLIDQFMPEVNGWVFLQTVRESPTLSGLPVVLVSAARPSRPTPFPVGMDFDHVMLKPICQDELAEFLARRLDIEWIWESPVAAEAAAVPDRPLTKQYPPREQLDTFRDLLTLGRVVALQRWADSLEQAYPVCAWFAGQVRLLCRAVDLVGLQALLDQAEGNIAVSAGVER
jgi:two-component system, sensor histidine kinase LadS